MENNFVPAKEVRTEITVVNSRFIAAAAPAFSVQEAREFIKKIRAEYPDASHHVPAYIIGHGTSVISHCSDDGEPSGTAGRPILMVLSGSEFGDIVLVVIRYFGGTKLGTGGLVRAYTGAAQKVLEITPKAVKLVTYLVLLEIPYSFYEQVKRILQQHKCILLDEQFTTEVLLSILVPVYEYDRLSINSLELTNGRVSMEIIETRPDTLVTWKD